MADNQGLLQVSHGQRDELESWAQSRSLPAGDVFRARLILSLADGMTYREIEQKLGASAPTVSKWKTRFEQHGVEALKIARIEKPVEYIRIVAGLMPKEFEIMDSRLADLSDEELDVFIAKLRAQLRSPVATDVGSGEEPTLNWGQAAILPTLSEAARIPRCRRHASRTIADGRQSAWQDIGGWL